VVNEELSNPQVVLPTAADVEKAAETIDGVVERTPLQYSPRLSEITGAKVYLKREDLQGVRSYKIRGAYNVIAQLNEEQRQAGVVAASAGNHAQGVAYACRTLGAKGRIYVPSNTPKQKRDRIMYHGGDAVQLVVTGNSFDDAAAAAWQDAQESGATWVAPFDDPGTIAGQGTIAREVVEQLAELGEEPSMFVVPVGGGGLFSGVVTYLAERSPKTEVVGVEPAGAACVAAALDMGGPVTLGDTDPFVDGAAVKRCGDVTYAVLNGHRKMIDLINVAEGSVCTEMLELYQNEGIIAEPAGALSVTALHHLRFIPGSSVVCIISGGNNDVSRYSEIIERSLVDQGLKHYFLVNFTQKPGQLRKFLDSVLGPHDDITLFEYVKRNNRETGAALVGIQLGTATGLHALLHRMEESGIQCERLLPGTPAYEYLT